MTDSFFRSAVINQDMQACQKFYSQNLSGAELVQILNDLLFCSVSVKQSTIKNLHPVCVLNSIKNLIGDDRENPSKLLLEFASNYLCGDIIEFIYSVYVVILLYIIYFLCVETILEIGRASCRERV